MAATFDVLTLALPKSEDKRLLVPPKILVSLSGSEMLPNLGVGGIFLDSDMLWIGSYCGQDRNEETGRWGRGARRWNYSTGCLEAISP